MLLCFVLKDVLKHSQRAGDEGCLEELRRALQVMCDVPRAANDMMQVGRLQGFDVRLFLSVPLASL